MRSVTTNVLRSGAILIAGLLAAGCSDGGSVPVPPTTASPVPTPVPTAPPTAAASPVASPHAVTFVAAGPANAQTATVTEAGYTGALTESDTCSGVATIAASGSTGPSVTYTITPNVAGSCTVTVTDAAHASDAVGVLVSTSGVIIQ